MRQRESLFNSKAVAVLPEISFNAKSESALAELFTFRLSAIQ